MQLRLQPKSASGDLASLDLLLHLLDGVGNVKTHNLGYLVCDTPNPDSEKITAVSGVVRVRVI